MADDEKFTLSEESRRVYKEIFESKDENKSGYINREELAECLFAIGFNPTYDDIEFLEKYFDRNGDGRISVDEILDDIHIVNQKSVDWREIEKAFKKFDKDNNGCISLQEMLKILTAPGKDQMEVNKARSVVTYLAENFDKNHDGKFSYPEFVDIFMNQETILKQIPEAKKEPVIETDLS